MEMMFLILHIGYSSVVLPDKYSIEQCQKIVKDNSNSFAISYMCIPAPTTDYCKYHYETFALSGATGMTKKVCDD